MTMQEMLGLGAPALNDPTLLYRVRSDKDGGVHVEIRRDRSDWLATVFWNLGFCRWFQSYRVVHEWGYRNNTSANELVCELANNAARAYARSLEAQKLDFWGNLAKLEGDHR